MKTKLKIFFILITIILGIIIFQNKVEASSYVVENIDIQATIKNDGAVDIEQTLTYKFDGKYNGIYITIPYKYENFERENSIESFTESKEIYSGKSITNISAKEINNGSQKQYNAISESDATNGIDGYYSITDENRIKKIKLYSPSSNTNKTYKINYTINDLCVKHNDIGELYYNFIGGKWETDVNNLNIDIYIPNNTSEIKVWGHGPYNGKSKIENNSHANFKVQNVKKGQYVAARVLFDKSNIEYSTKLSGINAQEIIYQEENAIIENIEEKDKFTNKIIICGIAILIYWIILMLLYEKDKKYDVVNIEEDELFKKYNPMIAGCIQGNRTILARDIIAVILELINKKFIKLEILNTLSIRENYIYILQKNPKKEEKMDNVEKFIYDWFFLGQAEKVNLADRLKEMPKEKDANIKFKNLNKLVETNLSGKKANQARVPKFIRILNVFIFIFSIVFIVKHVMFNGFNIYNFDLNNIKNYFNNYALIGLIFIPIILLLLYIPLNIITIIRHKINNAIQKITGQKIVTTTISIILLFGIIMFISNIFIPEKYILADEFLICVATILILTDNLMLKNDAFMIEDYSKLNALKKKIENYTLMESRDVEQVTLWEKYLSYAVSFGIVGKIVKRIKGLNLDDDLLNIINSQILAEILLTDYFIFYDNASLDRKFMRSYRRTSGQLLHGMSSGSGGYSDGRRSVAFLEVGDSLVEAVVAGGRRSILIFFSLKQNALIILD